MATRRTKGRPVYVVDAARTPFLKAKSEPGPFLASDLAVQAGRALLLRNPLEPEQLDQVILGCVMPRPEEANIGRVVALRLGCGKAVPGWTVQRNCASGLQALDSAAKDISLGRSDLVLAGGTEAMSHAPLLYSDDMVRWLAGWMGAKGLLARLKQIGGLRPGHLKPVIALLKGLKDPVVGLSMGQTAEELAHRFGIDRAAMDSYSVRSHQRLAAAQEQGHLNEITPIYDSRGNSYSSDTGLRTDSSVEKLATLRPFFDRPFGNITAANSSQVTDGAAWLLLASEAACEAHGLTPRARIVDVEWAGLNPEQMGLGPVHSSAPLLKRNRLKLEQIDFWELNEAFAAQVLGCLAAFADKEYCRQELGLRSALGEIDQERLNVDGGAVAIGHPIGASGARVTLHLLNVLEREGGRYGIATLCIGGGQGGALLLENIDAEGQS